MADIKPMVTVATIQAGTMTLSIQSNGKLEALKKVDLRFAHDGVVEEVPVMNGDNVDRGALVARQDDEYPRAERERIRESMQKAQLTVQDILLGAGYADTTLMAVPKEVMTMARVRSGLAETKQQAVANRKLLGSTRLTTPFAGVIASVTVKPGDMVAAGQRVGTLIDNRELWATFFILEDELGLVHRGDTVHIAPIARPGMKIVGHVAQINPMVDAHGFVEIKALVRNTSLALVDGMHVNVLVTRRLHRVIAIPKLAIVKRQGRDAVFILKNGKTVWRYVDTGQESADSVVVTSGLHNGETLVIEGNEHMAHDVAVDVHTSTLP